MSSIAAKDYQDGFFCRNPGLRQPLQLMKAVPDASFFVKDTHYRYVMVNDAFVRLFGIPRERAIGSMFTIAYH